MIRSFILGHFRNKLKDLPTLVVYDRDERYKDILPSLVDEHTKVFDTTEDVLLVREEALSYYTQILSQDTKAKMVVYVPFSEPLTRQEKLMDPFFIFSFGGSIFPYDAADKYQSLCMACFPEKEQKIRELFAQEIPDFDTLDALGGGNTWVKLQTLTSGKSDKEILLGLLTPSETQKAALMKNKNWIREYKDFAEVIGLETKGTSYEAVSKELWRFILFSEFVFDLPIDLPDSLKNISIAKPAAKGFIMELCKSIRDNKNFEELYIEKAEEVSAQLGLAELFKNEHKLGEIVTFSFEDNTYFFHFMDLLKNRNWEEAKAVTSSIKENIWLHHDEDRRRYWKMAELGSELLQLTTGTFQSVSSLKDVILQYTDRDYKIDQLQRRFERQAMDVSEENAALSELKELVRKQYSLYTEKTQKRFQERVKKEHWPVEGVLYNSKVFEQTVQPLLKAKIKCAYILVDALRFELGKELGENLEKNFIVQVTPSCAYIPTATKYGMAALLPDAEAKLSLRSHQGKLEAFMGEQILLNLADRRSYLKDKLGTLCEIASLTTLSSSSIPNVDLLVITTNEIDNAGENLIDALPAMQQAVQKLVGVLNKLKQNGFEKIVIATDHGFVLQPLFQSGDNVSKPPGVWTMNKLRSLAGSGASADYTLTFSPEEIGVKSDVQTFVFLKNYAVFEKNATYFHEGISLQETIVPVIVLTPQKARKEKKIQINLTYKGKERGAITTRRPFMEITSFIEGELGLEPISVRLEAISGETTVGKAGSDEHVSEVTNLVEIVPGQAFKIPLEMNEQFEGSFEVTLTDPVTDKLLASISLQTDYI